MTTKNERITNNYLVNQIINDSVAYISNAYIIDCRSRGLKANTIRCYELELISFIKWLESQGVVMIQELTADQIRKYLLYLQEFRNPGGQHGGYRVIRAMLYFWERETDDDYKSPIRKVRPPKVNNQPLPGVTLDQINLLVESVKGEFQTRGRAILYMLGDTGLRASELCDLNIGDIDLNFGTAIVRDGKGGKRRVVFFSQKTRKELRKYLRSRKNIQDREPLFTTKYDDRFTYEGLRTFFRRLVVSVGLPEISLHDFRRFFALQMLRKGADIISISRMMGHSQLTVLTRYLNQIDDDLRQVHYKANPLD